MLYIEVHSPRPGWSRVFSTTDNERELEKFRCTVRAPREALKTPTLHAKDVRRAHLMLNGRPRELAAAMLTQAKFETPIERMLWERSQPDVVKLHPDPFHMEIHRA